MAGGGLGGAADGSISRAATRSDCSRCGEPAFVLARSCPGCGAPRKLGWAGLTVAGALALLLLAAVTAIGLVLGRYQLAAATEGGEVAGEPIAMGSRSDVSWLRAAMSQCDADAKADAETLHFLVIPLAAVDGDLAPWHDKAINDSGNGIMLRSEAALDGLKSGTLRLYGADYAFGVLDATGGNMVYQWRPAMGVSKFAAGDPPDMPTFSVQFRTARSGSDPEQGGSFTRAKGSCYWVNAIIRR